ncbi:uncharacterized protein LOC132543640 [Ylistrum balloti]|uniref:uncharacterized protein LOC132543640 n=1 Tax=Ylistrum balloti TaxID=509963 RepID=UPI002905BAB3|nr:uncharacterized protein LOC132543640 [Ylistrum balloti]
MAAMLVTFVLVICVSVDFSVSGKNIDIDNGKDSDSITHPQAWHDLVSFVSQKIEGIERVLAEKDKVVDKLESQITLHEKSILQRDAIIDKLVERVSDLEKIVIANQITEKHDTRHHGKSETEWSTSDTNNLEQYYSTINKTTHRKTQNWSKSLENKTQGNRLPSKTTPFSQSLVDNDESENVPVEKFSRSRQSRVAPPSGTQTIAFHTAISGNRVYAEDAIIVYDDETLDHGNGYSPSDGLYTVPETGTYVLTWTIISGTHQEYHTLLEVNGVVRGASFSDTTDVGDFHQSSSLVVLSLNEGDHVFIRMGHTTGHWTIISTDVGYGYSTFSGWRLD